MKDRGVRAFSVHPGGIVTPLQRHLEQQEMVALGWFDENGEITEFAKDFFKTVPQGAATTVWCAVSPQLDGLGGLYCEDCDVAKVTVKGRPDAVSGSAAACSRSGRSRPVVGHQ